MKSREAQIKEIIEVHTDREPEIIESMYNIVIRFKKIKGQEKNESELRKILEKEFRQFHPVLTYVIFF